MFPWNPSQWTEPYLLSLLGQPESGRLEFKSGKAVAKKEDKDKFMRDQLSPAVSAFANSEGGIIVIGMDEDRAAKPRVASQLDGIAIGPGNAIDSPEQFQQLVDSCISPFLPGLAVRRVALSGNLQGRLAVIVHVPQGTTAYQAKDHLYYSRSEFETKSMPDHEVRLRMSRGKIARAAVYLRIRDTALGSQHEVAVRAQHAPALEAFKEDPTNLEHGVELLDVIAARFHPDEFSFYLILRNDGELTIRDPAVKVLEDRSQQLFDGWMVQAEKLPARLEMRGEVIYPGDEREIKGSACKLRCKRETILAKGDYVVRWEVFLDNSPPSEGAIDLGAELQIGRK